MDFISITAIAIGLAMDAFSVSVVCGSILERPAFRHYFRVSFHFGLFQFLMPLLGYFAGNSVENIVKDYDHWVAMALLSLIGIKMIRDSLSGEQKSFSRDPTKGYLLILLSFATSIDAFAVGLSLGVLAKPVLIPSAIIGIVCFIFSALGIFLGKRVGGLFGRRVERAGGIILIAIGIKIVIEHLMF